MAFESDGFSVTTVVTCEGDLLDPCFPKQLRRVLGKLENILRGHLYVCKLEPWNSVRVTLSIPREAAQRLRQLAREGSQQLRALGILSVQVEGDQVISLRLAGSERQEIVLQTVQQDEGSSSNTSATSDGGLSRLLSGEVQVPANPASSDKMQFRSPNVVCPPDSVVPKVPTTPGTVSSSLSSSRLQSGPFPFTSMNQAIQSRENNNSSSSSSSTSSSSLPTVPVTAAGTTSGGAAATSAGGSGSVSTTSGSFAPPPPYPGKHPPVTLSSPLLVNLLQNDGTTTKSEMENPSTIQANGSIVHPKSLTQVSAVAKNFPHHHHIHHHHQQQQPPSQPPASPSSSVQFAPKMIPTLPTRTTGAIYQQPLPSPSPHHPKIVHSQQPTVTVNSSLSADHPSSSSSFKHLVHQQRINNSSSSNSSGNNSVSTSVTSNNSAKVSAMNNNIVSASATATVVGVVRQTTNSPTTTTTTPTPTIITKPSAVIQNSGELELSSQSTIVAANKIISPLNIHQHATTTLVPPNSSVALPHQEQSAASLLDDAKSFAFRSCSPSLMDDLTPTLTDLKESDLDQLLPTLERDIASSPPELPEMFTDTKDRRKFLINPLTGELELQSSSDESECDADETPRNVFTDLPSPAASASDDDSTTTAVATPTTSSSVANVSMLMASGNHHRLLSSYETASAAATATTTVEHSDEDSVVSTKSSKLKSTKSRPDRCGAGRDSPKLKPTEKIKLRLKLEKSEPVSSGYKVDVSFINAPPKKATASAVTGPSEELRVPPLHISLRGRNHVVINNKKKMKVNADGSITKPKVRKTQSDFKLRKVGGESDLDPDDRYLSPLSNNSKGNNNNNNNGSSSSGGGSEYGNTNINVPLDHTKPSALDSTRKIRKIKTAQEHREQNLLTGGHLVDRSKDYEHHQTVYNNSHFKEKLKERRGSDSELTHHNAKRLLLDNNGLISSADKKRRLSQTDESHQSSIVVGSTNVGTTMSSALGPKAKKEKLKVKEGNIGGSGNVSSKGKEIDRSKSYAKNLADKLASKQVALPTGDMDMEAKFKQRLLENNTTTTTTTMTSMTSDKIHNNNRPSYRNTIAESNVVQQKAEEQPEHMVTALPNPIPHKGKPPEIIDQKGGGGVELTEKQASRSPNSGGQGEDSGIESMDALSEKSPNQAGQSPHGDNKTQVPDILDIEAQLAKMEGLNGVEEDMNENKQEGAVAKLEKCCNMTEQQQQQQNVKDVVVIVKNVVVGGGKDENDDLLLDPLPVRVTPPLYTYSNAEKMITPSSVMVVRSDVNSPTLSDSDNSSNSCPPVTLKSKSLLEQLLIDIPGDNNQTTTNSSSPSPVTRSLRTRACSKLNSPELLVSPPPLSSSVPPSVSTRDQQHQTTTTKTKNLVAMPATSVVTMSTAATTTTTTTTTTPTNVIKRKRQESEGSNNAGDDASARNSRKHRKCSENAIELIKACMGVDGGSATGPLTIGSGGNAAVLTKNVPVVMVGSKNKTTSATSNARDGGGGGGGRIMVDESSDSDEPLIEVAGKVRKNNNITSAGSLTMGSGGGVATSKTKTKLATGGGGGGGGGSQASAAAIAKTTGSINTRRSVRATPALNTRSKGDRVVMQTEAEVLRRKTRSSVTEVEGKRRKDVK